jgi:internalin A
MSELALQLIAENKRTKDTFLDLGNCGLENELPDELFDCTWLEGLNLGSQYYHVVSDKIIYSMNNGKHNFLKNCADARFTRFECLRRLYLHGLGIEDLS